MSPAHLLRPSNHAAVVGLIAIVASFVAHAEVVEPSPAVPPSEALTPAVASPSPATKPGTAATLSKSSSTSPAASKRAFRGSSLSYGHQATAYSFVRSAQPTYNPIWSHSLGIAPEWHFNDQLFARARLSLEQEFTLSETRGQVELSDLTVDLGLSGWTDPFAGIRIGGDLRLGFPTSKGSRYRTRRLAIGPGLNVSRTFPLRSGLILGYSGRYSYRFHEFTTARLPFVPNTSCPDQDPECVLLRGGDDRNAHSDLSHGPAISFSPFSFLTLAASAQFSHQWLYPLPEAEVTNGRQDTPFRYFNNVDVSVTWQVFKPIALTVGASTLSLQLNTEGTRQFSFFDRNTTLYLDASFDLEAAAAGIFGDPS